MLGGADCPHPLESKKDRYSLIEQPHKIRAPCTITLGLATPLIANTLPVNALPCTSTILALQPINTAGLHLVLYNYISVTLARL